MKTKNVGLPRADAGLDPFGRSWPTAAESRRVAPRTVESPYGNGFDGVVAVADTLALLAGRGKLTPAEMAAAERYRRAASNVASLGDCVLGKDGGTRGVGAPSGMSGRRLNAALVLNDASRILGPTQWVVHAVCAEGRSLVDVAAKLSGVGGGKVSREARSGASALLKAGLSALAARWFADRAAAIGVERADDARGEIFSDGQVASISAGVSVHCTVRRVYYAGAAR